MTEFKKEMGIGPSAEDESKKVAVLIRDIAGRIAEDLKNKGWTNEKFAAVDKLAINRTPLQTLAGGDASVLQMVEVRFITPHLATLTGMGIDEEDVVTLVDEALRSLF